jgi:hypothetical protein
MAFSLRHPVQTGSVSLPNSYPMGTPEAKRPGHEADRSPPSNAEVKKEWSYTSTRPIRLGVMLN